MTREEIEEQIKNTQREIEELKTITEIGNLESFELIIKKIKDDCIKFLLEEDFKSLKQCVSKINKMRDFTDYIEKQTQIIEDKESEIEDLQYQLDHYQTNLFEDSEQKKFTGIEVNDEEICTGDIFEGDEEDFYIITESKEKPDNFAIVSNVDTEEKLLQYPKNREILLEVNYLGNLYEDEELRKKFILQEHEDNSSTKNDTTPV